MLILCLFYLFYSILEIDLSWALLAQFEQLYLFNSYILH